MPSTASLSVGTDDDAGVHDLGISPLSQGVFPPGPSGSSDLYASASVSRQQGRGLLAAHRTSVLPASSSSIPDGQENTDEYAQIILASRNAKMRKWKTSTSSIGTVGFDAALGSLSREAFSRRPIPNFDEEHEPDEADITSTDGADFGVAGYNKEIEWVDWLDEYRKMKEAKVRAEQQARPPPNPTSFEANEESAPTDDDTKGKGKAAPGTASSCTFCA